jgi:hypothetical protein
MLVGPCGKFWLHTARIPRKMLRECSSRIAGGLPQRLLHKRDMIASDLAILGSAHVSQRSYTTSILGVRTVVTSLSPCLPEVPEVLAKALLGGLAYYLLAFSASLALEVSLLS